MSKSNFNIRDNIASEIDDLFRRRLSENVKGFVYLCLTRELDRSIIDSLYFGLHEVINSNLEGYHDS